MDFNDLLTNRKSDPKTVLVLRHRPPERELRKVFRLLAAERPKTYNAYQQTQGLKVERSSSGPAT